MDPCLTRTHVLRQSCTFFLKCLWYAKTRGFFSSTNLRAATLLLILYQPPTCCETLCLLSHASSTILQILSQMRMVCGRRTGRTRTHVRGRSIKLSVSNPRSVRPSPPCLTHTSVRQRSVIPWDVYALQKSGCVFDGCLGRTRVFRHVLSAAHDSRSSVLLSYVYLRAAALLRTLRQQLTFFETLLARLTCAYVLRPSCASTINPYVLRSSSASTALPVLISTGLRQRLSRSKKQPIFDPLRSLKIDLKIVNF